MFAAVGVVVASQNNFYLSCNTVNVVFCGKAILHLITIENNHNINLRSKIVKFNIFIYACKIHIHPIQYTLKR